ncbi:MAG: hypothetical protein RJP95_00180, partial [Pirellulales bacterium]
VSFEDIKDGLSNTIALVEVSGLDIDWTEPRDLTFDEFVTRLGNPDNLPHFRGFNVLFGDGSVMFIDRDIDPEALRSMFTIAGGEPIDRQNL